MLKGKFAFKVFEYEKNNISFKTINGVVYVKATDMAKPFGKKPNNYLVNQSTIDFVNALKSQIRNSGSDLILVQNGGKNEDRGTWMHEDVALDFAQWLSPMFRVWCNSKIKELLTTGKAELTQMSDEEMALMVMGKLQAKVDEQKQKLIRKWNN